MAQDHISVTIAYLTQSSRGELSISVDDKGASGWKRLLLEAFRFSPNETITETTIQLPWADILTLIRRFGSKAAQTELQIKLNPVGDARTMIQSFFAEYKKAQSQRQTIDPDLSTDEIERLLIEKHFTKRQLKPFQLRDLQRLISIPNGANFSVPGAGKTTVTFALNTLLHNDGDRLLVICPKAAFQAWTDIVGECISDEAPKAIKDKFILLDGSEKANADKLFTENTRFVMSYDLMIRQQNLIQRFLLTHNTHMVLDESHRMKAGWESQRGSFLLSISSIPIRRDILSGTPMPQGPSDIASQLEFLWPGHGLGAKVERGIAPRTVLGSLYARTTKQELGLRTPKRIPYDVSMKPGQLALYAIVRSEALRQVSQAMTRRGDQSVLLRARRSVMRLLQLSSNPLLALSGMANDDVPLETGIVEQVIEEGHSSKVEAVMDHARTLAKQGEKVVIWTIFTDTIKDIENGLADLNPVSIYGQVPSGDKSDPHTREGRIHRFHVDPSCWVLVANPAAAGEGISLHTVCHNAIYVDRSYVSTHYIQSIDRIHRLGLAEGVETYIHLYRTKAPPRLGSIDMSVSRRLMEKIRNMQELLDDPDLLQLVLDEEEADDALDYDIGFEDLEDLIKELEGNPTGLDLEK